ncbi:hypothetical protein NTE_02301 [Candidatus Nitrososphaera evergladensis SR1]|uniref:Uncharacterized protein n=1 Tax=Candidatus Nitrososphaera evergladensis SR1 TaxID=1459636 RepID=A0A075MYL3_9ARCH|nr:hypothetical protein [Candidatus Nitrososphaera evergladensis]AIF84354.1 hypothetical protein NTE_02301 [Candidatus Nitrososphaera evergladensis SR1]
MMMRRRMATQSIVVLLCAAFVLGAAALAVPAAANTAAYAQSGMSIEVNAPILKVKPGESAVKNIVVYGTGADSMKITNITFEKGREFFRLGNALPEQATLDPATGKLKAEVPLIVTLPPEILKDAEYPFTVTAASGQSSVQADSHALVVVVTAEKPADPMSDAMVTVMYIVVAAGGVVSIIVYKRMASKK